MPVIKHMDGNRHVYVDDSAVETCLSYRWSIFDFIHPGLLSSSKVFTQFTKRRALAKHFGRLRSMVRPCVLRRITTNNRVITNFSDKTEWKAFYHQSPTQAALHQRAVKELAVKKITPQKLELGKATVTQVLAKKVAPRLRGQPKSTPAKAATAVKLLNK